MKNNRRIIALALVIALAVISFTGCSCSLFNSNKISEADAQKMSGTWELVAAELDGKTVTAKDIGATMDFVFNKNGKATYVLNGESTEYKWTIEEDLITIWVPEGGVDKGHTAVLDGNHFTLYWNYNGQAMKMIFAKKGTDDMDPNKYVASNNTTTQQPSTQANTQPAANPAPAASNSTLAGTYDFSSRLYNGKWWSEADSEVYDCYLTLKPEGAFILSIYGNQTTGIYEYDGTNLYLVTSPTADGVTNTSIDGNTITVYNPPGNYPSIEALKFTKR